MMKPAVLAVLAAALALSGCGDGGSSTPAPRPPLAGSNIGGPFTLEDEAGHVVHWSDFAGHPRIVYFGYSFCPDACPTDLATEIRGLNLFARSHPAIAANIRPMFITVDPARDTPKVVGEFAAAFSPRLIGLTGTAAQVDAAAKAFGAFYQRGDTTPGGYLMEHTRFVYLMAADGAPLALLPVDQGAAAVADELARWAK